MGLREQILSTWDLQTVKTQLMESYNNNSELELLRILKQNTFLFYELYSRKLAIQPVFHEVSFGGEMRCDFAWLNDNSSGPEWVLVEVEKPQLDIFTKNNDVSAVFNHAIEQVRSWQRYFYQNPSEKNRIFGAVANFRYILIAGSGNSWKNENAARWRAFYNAEQKIEIYSSDVFLRPLNVLEEKPELLWSFAEKPTTLPPSNLQEYWTSYAYMDFWRKLQL